MCIVWSKLERIIDILTGPSHTQTKTSVFDLRSVWPTGYQEASMKQGTPCRCFPLNDGEKGNRDTVNSPGLHHNHCNYSRDCAKSKQINEAYQLFFYHLWASYQLPPQLPLSNQTKEQKQQSPCFTRSVSVIPTVLSGSHHDLHFSDGETESSHFVSS